MGLPEEVIGWKRGKQKLSAKTQETWEEILRLWNQPPYLTLQKIADRFGVSRQCIGIKMKMMRERGIKTLTFEERRKARFQTALAREQ